MRVTPRGLDRQSAGRCNFMTPGDNTVLRAMPTVGLEYRYPFISIHAWAPDDRADRAGYRATE